MGISVCRRLCRMDCHGTRTADATAPKDGQFICDDCDIAQSIGETWGSCRQCDFDVCLSCFCGSLRCSEGHSLQRFESSKSFICDGCDVDLKCGERLRSCRKCDFDLCEACVGKICGRTLP